MHSGLTSKNVEVFTEMREKPPPLGVRRSQKWAKEDGPSPRPETARRLYFAYEQWQQVADAEGEHVARVWFIGANPWLGYDTPVNAIREGRFSDVASAAQSLVNDTFSG